MTRKHISIILPDLRGGGAERLHVHLANDWAAQGYSVEMVLMQKRGDFLTMLRPEVSVIGLDINRGRNLIGPLKRHLKKSKPDVILSAMWPLTSITAIAWLLAGRHGRLFLSDHNQLSISCLRELKISPVFLKTLMRVTYPLATSIIAVSQGVKEDLCRLGGFRDGQVRVIYNPTATGVSPHREPLAVRHQLWGTGYAFHVLAVGTLKPQKDHETLIKAFAQLPPGSNAKLTILGEGPLRPQLQALVQELGLTDSVSLPGFTNDPYPWFRSADLFVSSSQWEGFGNVIVEALECGVPVVSTDCPSGPAEILDNGRFGRLVKPNDPVALSEAILTSFAETPDREKLMERAQMFSVRNISDQYIDCIFEADN